MLNQIILIVTHGNPSTNKILMRSIQQKGLDTKFGMVVNYKAENHETGMSQYNLELIIPKIDDISEEHRILMRHLPEPSEVFTMEDISKIFFNALVQIKPSLIYKKPTDVFDFHLFTEVNLKRVSGECITREFHDSVHIFGNYFRDLVSPCANHYYVYGYSQTQIAREKAKKYFSGELVDGLELTIKIDSYAVDIKENLRNYFLHEDVTVDDKLESDSLTDRTIKPSTPLRHDLFFDIKKFPEDLLNYRKTSEEIERVGDSYASFQAPSPVCFLERDSDIDRVRSFSEEDSISDQEISQTFVEGNSSIVEKPTKVPDSQFAYNLVASNVQYEDQLGLETKTLARGGHAFFKFNKSAPIIPKHNISDVKPVGGSVDIGLAKYSNTNSESENCCVIS